MDTPQSWVRSQSVDLLLDFTLRFAVEISSTVAYHHIVLSPRLPTTSCIAIPNRPSAIRDCTNARPFAASSKPIYPSTAGRQDDKIESFRSVLLVVILG